MVERSNIRVEVGEVGNRKLPQGRAVSSVQTPIHANAALANAARFLEMKMYLDQKLNEIGTSALEGLNLFPAHFRAIMLIGAYSEGDQPLSKSDLYAKLNVQKQSFPRVEQELLKHGLITHEADHDDRRITRIRLSEKGMGLYRGILGAYAPVLQNAASALNLAVGNLTQFLEALINAPAFALPDSTSRLRTENAPVPAEPV